MHLTIPVGVRAWLDDSVAWKKHVVAIIYGLIAIAAVSFYVFKCTPYENYLFSDMQGFWRRAMDRYNGKDMIESQFIAWPPLYHIFLGEFFSWLRKIGLENWVMLETALLMNIIAFGISVYSFYFLASRWFERKIFVHLAVLFYAFGFPSFYFNAFLLSGNLGVPLMVVGIALIVCQRNWVGLGLAAFFTAVSAIIRPSFAPYGLSFILFYFLYYRFTWAFIARAAVFTLIFFGIVFLGMAEVNRISKGKVSGLSANGGLDFFIAQSHYHRVDLNYDGWHWFVVVPAYSFKPRNGFYSTNTPFYRQNEYYRLGWLHLKHNPIRLLQNVEHVKNLFIARMLPSRKDAPGFASLMPVFNWLKVALLATLGLYCVMWRELGEHRPFALLMLSMIFLTAFLSYWFTGEPRYTYSILFTFFLLGFKTIEWLISKGRRAWKILAVYCAIIGAITGSVSALVVAFKPRYTPTLQFTEESLPPTPDSQTIATKPQSLTFNAGWFHFPYKSTVELRHYDVDHPALTEPAVLRSKTTARVTSPQELTLELCSAYPFDFWHNSIQLFSDTTCNYFMQSVYRLQLDPGTHTFESLCHFTGSPGGLSLYYSYWENNWQYRYPFGVSSSAIQFEPVASENSNPAKGTP